MTDDNLRMLRMPGNGMIRHQQSADCPKDRTQLLKYAIFYLTVAAVLFATNRAVKNPTAGTNQAQWGSRVHLDLSVVRKSERSGSSIAGERTYVVRFRLRNQGNQPIFYPVSSDTNRPIGEIVYRVAPQCEWKPLELPSRTRPQLYDQGVAWIEMPPGGWVDGEYEDPGSPMGDHAYELVLKTGADSKLEPLFSRGYTADAN